MALGWSSRVRLKVARSLQGAATARATAAAAISKAVSVAGSMTGTGTGSAGLTTSNSVPVGTGVVTTLQLISTQTGTFPFTVGQGFSKGDVPVTLTTNLANYQVKVLRRWNDGSVKHAIISGRAAFSANLPNVVTISRGVYSEGAPLTATNILNRSGMTTQNQNRVTCGAIGHVDLADLLSVVATPATGMTGLVRTFISGPEMVECHYRGNVGGTTDLSVWFHVRLYADDRVWIRTVVENGYLDNGGGAASTRVTRSYSPVIRLGGAQVYAYTPIAISSITTASVGSNTFQETITTAEPHNLSVDRGQVYMTGIGGMTQLNDYGWMLTGVTGPNTFVISHANAFTPYTSGGHLSFAHWYGMRWTYEGWIGGDPVVTPKHNITYLRTAKFIPNYTFARGVSAATTAGTTVVYNGGDFVQTLATGGLPQSATPPTSGHSPSPVAYLTDMGSGGSAQYIGLLPNWDALYASTDADPRAWRAMLANEAALNLCPIGFRARATQRAARPTDFPMWSINGPNQPGSDRIHFGGAYNWEYNHHPSAGYLGYLLSGDYFYLETMELQSALCYLGVTSHAQPADIASFNGSGVNKIMRRAPRGAAWAQRTVSQYVAIAPESDLGSTGVAGDYQTLLANNITWWKNLKDVAGFTTIGYIFEPGGTNFTSMWMQNYWSAALGHGSDIEPLASMTDYVNLRNHLYRGIVGTLGGATGADFCFSRAGDNAAIISSGTNPDPVTWYDTWPEVYAATAAAFGWGACSTTLQGGSGSAPNAASYGRWGQVLGAISYAVDHGATNAQTAFNRLKAASNWQSAIVDGQAIKWEDATVWGVTPRNYTPYLPYTLPAAGELKSVHLNSLTGAVETTGWFLEGADSGIMGSWVAWTGGCYAPQFSTHGAMLFWGGGHGSGSQSAPYCFDLSTGLWSQIGVNVPVNYLSPDIRDASWQDYYYAPFDSYVTPAQHTYGHIDYLPPAFGGGPKGSLMVIQQVGPVVDGVPRLVDLATGKHKRSTAVPYSAGGNTTDTSSVMDTTRGIIYGGAGHQTGPTWQFDANAPVGTWTRTSSAIKAFGFASVAVYVPEVDHIITYHRNNLNSVLGIWMYDCSAGGTPVWFVPNQNEVRTWFRSAPSFDWCPETASFYFFEPAISGDRRIHKLTPPASIANWRTGTWVWSTETMGGEVPVFSGEATRDGPNTLGAGAALYNRVRYNRSLKCFMLCEGAVVRASPHDGVLRNGAFQLYKPLGVS